MAPPLQAINKYYLVVVADESRADLYKRERLRGPMELARTFENEAARLKTDELLADRGGRAFDSHGHGRHTMSPSGPARNSTWPRASRGRSPSISGLNSTKATCTVTHW